MIQQEDLVACRERISAYIHHTPVLTSRLIDKLTDAQLFFKCENFQRMGAFKMRGAVNAILQLNAAQRKKGVVTHSSGNFAQALSLAAESLGVKAFIVMPANAANVKKNAVRDYGGVIYESEPTLAARSAVVEKIVRETGAYFIHPSNDIDVIIGQGTACMELLEAYPDLNVVVAPVGGGGLIAGTAMAAHYFGRDCEVIGGEPSEADDAYRSLRSGKIETNATANTIADGLRTELGDKNFPIILKHVHQIIRVSEQEIIDAMKLIWQYMKIVIEPSSAVAFAAVIREKNEFKNKKIGVILSGGNVDLKGFLSL